MNLNIENLPDAAHGAVHISDLPDVGFIAVSLLGSGLILFVLFVLPVWLFLHYRSRSRHLQAPPAAVPLARPVSSDELAELARIAERIEHRLDAVETLMDAENPRWRR